VSAFFSATAAATCDFVSAFDIVFLSVFVVVRLN
jgi:hypothetical protein